MHNLEVFQKIKINTRLIRAGGSSTHLLSDLRHPSANFIDNAVDGK